MKCSTREAMKTPSGLNDAIAMVFKIRLGVKKKNKQTTMSRKIYETMSMS